jgi:uncharacterized protein YqeY
VGLKQKLENDLKEALRSKDERRKTTLRLALAAIQNAEISKGEELDESELIGVISKEAKLHRESAEKFAEGARDDLVAQEEEDLSILKEYLPAQLSQEETEARVREAIEEVGASSLSQMGDVMRVLMPQLKGQADGQVVSDTVKRILGSTDQLSCQ